MERRVTLECIQDAAKCGEALQGTDRYYLVEAEFPTPIANTLIRWERLDGIGPARYAE
jgi:hypothetical protein